jgi:1,4-dihydroxy-2-naphthoate octaprenyltransferase
MLYPLMKTWLITMRIWSLTATTMPVALGAVVAHQDGHFSWLLLGLMLVCGWTLQLATNLLNTYGDGVSGVDKDKPPCPFPLPLVLRVGFFFLFIGILLAGLIMFLSTWKLIFFAVVGIIGAASYTTRFFKYAGLGVPGVFLLTGPLQVLAAYYAFTQGFSTKALLLSLPMGCLVAAILHGNDLRDIATDRVAKIKTFSHLIGEQGAFALYVLLNMTPFVLLFVLMALYPPGYAFMPPFLAFPLALGLSRDALKRQRVETLEERSAGCHFLFCLLLVGGLLLF